MSSKAAMNGGASGGTRRSSLPRIAAVVDRHVELDLVLHLLAERVAPGGLREASRTSKSASQKVRNRHTLQVGKSARNSQQVGEGMDTRARGNYRQWGTDEYAQG